MGPDDAAGAILPYLAKLPDIKRSEAICHLSGVAQCSVLLAFARGLDPRLAALAGWLHDVYSFATGIRRMHDLSGAECARVILEQKGWCSAAETAVICRAIGCHSDKAHIGEPYEELLKDADILQRMLSDPKRPFSSPKLPRIRAMKRELGLSFEPVVKPDATQEPPAPLPLAPAARRLALQHIGGDTSDTGFMEIIRYWPEPESPQALAGHWAAAFVYHLCMSCNRPLPIRAPGISCRFSRIAAWMEYAQIHGQLHQGGQPHPGDLVVFSLKSPADHMGIFLGCSQGKWEMAEGNMDNRSEVTLRDPGRDVCCFFPAPDGL